MPAAVASRYARALADVVLAPGSPAEPGRILQDLRSFEQTLAGAPELINALESPAVKRPKKRAIIARIGQSLSLSRVGQNFLLVLADHRRINDLSEAIVAFERIVDERLGRLQVDVASATQLKDSQQA